MGTGLYENRIKQKKEERQYSTRLIIEKQCNATERIEPAKRQVQRSTIERERVCVRERERVGKGEWEWERDRERERERERERDN
ncbi:hypothetical protein J6590_100226, partial [Homalodisca vitripennis]